MTTRSIVIVDEEKAVVTPVNQNVKVNTTTPKVTVSVASSGPQGIQGPQGVKGDQGEKGDAATVAVGSVIASQPGSDAEVINVGTSTDAIFNFVIPRGIQGPQGIPGELVLVDVHYVHEQSIPSEIWTITHTLQFIPSITVVDSAGSVVEGDYSYPNENTIIATFSGAFAGKAYLS